MSTVTGNDVQKMIGHWLQSPTNGYLGSDYGQDLPALLQRPQADGSADDFLEKLRDDVPIINALPDGSTNIYGVKHSPDRLDLVLEVAGTLHNIPNNVNQA